MELPIRITKYLGDDPQPGIVECEFEDADGRTHVIVDKVLIFVDRLLSEQDSYPLPGSVQCEALAEWRSADGRDLARIRTLETMEGLSEFVVTRQQLR